MLKKLSDNTLAHALIVFFVAIVAFLPTLQMFFYLDEWGNLYEFTHMEYTFSIFTADVFHRLFNLFGTNPTGYFAVGILIYALSVVIFYLFVSKLLKNKLLGLVAGLIYATAPIGIDTVIMLWTYVIEGGYPLTAALLIILYLLLRYFQGGKIVFYLLALLGFMIFMELEPRRVFLFLPIIVIFDYVMHFRKIIVPDIKFIIRQVPFVLSFVAYYKYTITLSNILATGKIQTADSSYDSETKLILFLNSIFDVQPLVTLANILLGGFTIIPVDFINLVSVKNTYFWVGLVLAIALTLVVIAWKTKREFGLLSLFGLIWIYVNIIGIYVFSSPGISETTHRTLSISAPGYALFMSVAGYGLYLYLKKRKSMPLKKLNTLFLSLLIFLVGYNLLATHARFEKFNAFRSRAAHAFFKDLKNMYPTFPKGSLIYIETSGSPQIKNRLSRIYGGNNLGAGATIAVFYPELTLKDIDVVREFVYVEKFIASDSAKIDKVYGFYYDENGLFDKTPETREKLKLSL